MPTFSPLKVFLRGTVHPRLSGPRLTGRVSLLLKGEKALSNKPPSFRFSAIVLMKVKLFNNLFC